MTTSISFQCTECEADFELEIANMIERPGSVRCSNCEMKPPLRRAEALAHALEELTGAMSGIRTHVRFEVNLDTALLPPPYGAIELNEEGGLANFDDDELDDDDDFDDESSDLTDGFDDDFDDDDDDDDDF